jgi:translation elongation factor EF-Tu-like GTPase
VITGDADFIAVLKYFTPEEGGRSKPVFSGYFPIVKFPFSKISTGGKQKFINKEIVYPGETVEAEIEVIGPHLFLNQLSEGMEFEISEGITIIGTGTIKQIINQDLKKL